MEWAILALMLLGFAFLFVFVARLTTSVRQTTDAQIAAHRQEMQVSLGTQTQSLNQQMAQLTQSVTQQLGQVTQSLQKGMADTGLLASKAQETMSAELKNSRELLSRINQQLGEVQQAGRELSEAAKTIEMVLGAAQTRGSLGEQALERLLADSLPQDAYEMQHRFSTGELVDVVIRVGEKLLPIDSKFPLDDYRRLVETGEEARKGFAQTVRAHADSIARKYILPGEGTLDIALMFVPSESVYYEILMTEDPKFAQLGNYCRSKNVVPVSPNTLYSYLSVILMGLRGMQIEENAKRLLANLGGLEKQVNGFAEVYGKVGTHLRHAQQSYEESEKKLDRARNALEQMAKGALPEADVKLLEPARKED